MVETGAQADPDLALVKRARGGDFAAFEALVAHHEQGVYRLARRIVRESHDAEEVVQDTFLSVLEHLNSFREESSVRAWVLRIATNASLKILRKRRGAATSLEARRDDDDAMPHPGFIAPWQENPADLAQRREVQHLLDEALAQIDEKYRLVFVLRDIESLSIEETAQALQLSTANVKVRLMRARLMLREILTRKFGDPSRALAGHRHP